MIRTILLATRRWLAKDAPRDLAAVGGVLLVTVGAAMAWAPLAWIVPGGCLVAAALAGHLRGGKKR